MLKLDDLQFGMPIFPSADTANGRGPRISKTSNNDMFDTIAPLLPSSHAWWRSICNPTPDVERLLAITTAVKAAQQLMLSSIIVVDDVAEMHELVSILHASMKSYNIPVCEFFVGIIWDGDSLTAVERAAVERDRQMQELRNTLSNRGIVVTLRRTPVLNTLIAALVQYKSQKTQSPGSSFTYQEDVNKFNTSVALFKAAKAAIEYKRLEAMKDFCIDGCVFDFGEKAVVRYSPLSVNSANVVKHPPSIDSVKHPSIDSSLPKINKKKKSGSCNGVKHPPSVDSVKHPSIDSSLPKINKKKKPDSVRLSRKKSAVKAKNVTFAESIHVESDSSWGEWNYSDEADKTDLFHRTTALAHPSWDAWNYSDKADKTVSIATYKTRLTKEGLDLEEEEMKKEAVALLAYRQELTREYQRLVAVTLPASLGHILILDDKDDDNDQDTTLSGGADLKMHVDVLSGRLDKHQCMVKPHCTVLLTQGASQEMH
jgi:hypothetical protein